MPPRLHGTTGAARAGSHEPRGFSLVELTIVIVIIGVLAAIAVPKMSQGTAGASEARLAANVTAIRNAIDFYQAEHGEYPPCDANLKSRLTSYTAEDGSVSATRDAAHPFGPYLRKVPAMPLGPNKGMNRIWYFNDVDVGWLYIATTGQITPNAPGNDASGKPYADY